MASFTRSLVFFLPLLTLLLFSSNSIPSSAVELQLSHDNKDEYTSTTTTTTTTTNVRPRPSSSSSSSYMPKRGLSSNRGNSSGSVGGKQRTRMTGDSSFFLTGAKGVGKGKGKGKGSYCIERNVLLLGRNLLESNFFQTTTDPDAEFPSAMDQEIYNLPLYDEEAFLNNNGEEIVIGTLQEQRVYLPPGNSGVECIGYYMFSLVETDDYPAGQIAGHFTCGTEFIAGTLSGGLGAYECATGFSDLVKITKDYFSGAGHQIFRLVICGGGSCSAALHDD